MSKADRFLRACRKEQTDVTPIWLQRQAGRYMPEYRELRAKYSFLELVKNPDLATEITLQPIERFDVDAAIIFADILPLLQAMGLPLEYVKGDGPVLREPVRSATDVASLATPPVEEGLGFTIEAVRQTRRALGGRVPLIGFSGAPFTLASYAIEGGGSKDYAYVKAFMQQEPKAWYQFMEKLAKMIGHYLRAQIAAGAQVVQLFDSWAGILSPYDYREHVLPHIRRAIGITRNGENEHIPIIYFSTGTAGILPIIADCGADVIGVDWRIDIADAWANIGDDKAIQGNLDPQLLVSGTPDLIQHQASRILDSVGGRPGHIFNLGHGILKTTPMEHVDVLIDYVHSYSRQIAEQTTD